MTVSDWILVVLLPVLLIAVGALLLVRGRAALTEANRVRGGFGGPPGSLDIGSELGFGIDHDEVARERLAARRRQLWGAILVGAGLLWLAVGLLLQWA